VLKFKHYGIGIIKGMMVTIIHLFRHPTVVQYPEQRLNNSRRFRGNELIWKRDKCTGCGTCAKTCPQGAIKIITSANMVENKYGIEKYEVDAGYCIQCGLCVESCPYDALYMGKAFERAKYRRRELVQTADEMLETAERPMSGYFHPEVAKNLPKQTLLLEKIKEDKK